MTPAEVSLNTIESFLAQKRIAMVGISRERQNIGLSLFEEFRRHGYEVLPVNPNVPEMLGQRCFARVQEIQPPPDAALLLTSPAVTNSVVRDCAEAGIKRIWMYRGGGHGSVSAEAVEFCRAHGIELVPGQCPFMFLSPVRSVHRFHRFVTKIIGHYPRRLNVESS
jgi:predicted CoA-binding protein